MAQWLESLPDNISVDNDKCIFCTECVDKCILDNLRFKASPCREACPLRINAQGYIQLTKRGEFEKAVKLIYESTLFPGVLGYICEATCEQNCSLLKVDNEAVAVRALKRYLVENYGLLNSSDPNWLENNVPDWIPTTIRKEKVAIIGGGPAGIMAATVLRKYGYDVTIFEASSRLGGLLSSCIPEFRLPVEVVEKELEMLHQQGIKVEINTIVGESLLNTILESYDATLIATGASKALSLGIPGESSSNVYSAVEFLKHAKSKTDNIEETCVGKKVVAIGGGNTAINAAQTAYRLGAESVYVVSLEVQEDMPAYKWEIEEAIAEGISIEAGWGPVAINKDNVEFRKCLQIYDEDRNFKPILDDDTKVIEADTVIVAIGQKPDVNFLNNLSIDLINGKVLADEITLRTKVKKVFAAGDVVLGPSSAVRAMAQGRDAAISIHRFLQGDALVYGRKDVIAAVVENEVDLSKIIQKPRIKLPKCDLNERNNFSVVEKTINENDALSEAERCASCGEVFGKHRTCWYCLPCEVECPQEALKVKIPFLMR